MRRFVFQPRWVLGHLLVVAAALVCVRLGGWQWDRAHETGSVQNWGYALQWPLFAVGFLVGWWRMLRLESQRLDELAEPAGDPGPPPAPAVPVARPEPAERDEEDEPLAAYNRMLAALAAQDAAHDAAQDAAQDAARETADEGQRST